MKKNLIIMLLFMLCIFPISCFAKENVDYESEIIYDVIDGDDLLISRISLPTSGVDLSIMSYKANLSNVRNSWVGTNAYFNVASNRRISITYSLSSSSTIGLFDMTSNSWISTTSGTSSTWIVSNLDINHKYVVAFKSNTGLSVNGYALITS